MYKRSLATIVCLCAARGFGYGQWQTISFAEYTRHVQSLHWFQQHINSNIHTIYRSIQNKPCTRSSDQHYFYVDPICLYQNKLPDMQFIDVIDTIREYIIGFDNVYNSTPTNSFNYEWAKPIYKDQRADNFRQLQKSLAHKTIATYHSIHEDKIQIPKHIIAQRHAAWYTFYASYNDTSMRRWCTKTNYDIALASIDRVLLYPWHVLNFNRHIQWLPYCTGRWRTDLMFYSWVCGSASQLYRVALLIPHIQILQRHWHSQRRWYYYGSDITGDDATIYEMNKQLEIKNNDKRGIYFRTIQEKKYDYLVAVSPYQVEHWVKIRRERETTLRTNLIRSIYDKTSRIIREEEAFPTSYSRKNNTRN